MKKIVFLLLLMPVCIFSDAQNVGIGNTTPNIHSILDLRNPDSKALLLPWATITARNALTSLPSGGMIYQNSANGDEPQGVYYKIGSAWRYLMTSNDIKKTWEKVSDDVQYSTTERIGIGTTTPTASVHTRAPEDGERVSLRMQGTFPSLSFDYGSVTNGSYVGRALIYGTTYGLMFANSVQSPTASMRFRLGNQDRIILEPDGTFKTNSEIRLTDGSFNEKGFLQMNGDDVRIGTVSSNNTGSFVVRTNGVDNLTVNNTGDLIPAGTIQFNDGAVQKAFVQRNGDDLRMGVNSNNNLGNVIMRLNGADRFRFDNDGRITLLADNTPTINFVSAGVPQASLQVQGQNLAINATSNQVRISNVLYADDGSNRVGVGTSTPEERLHVSGNVKISSGKILNNSNESMLPYGYALFRADGTKARGTASLTGGWIGTDFMLDASNGEDLSDAIVSITCFNARLMPSYSVSSSSNRLKLNFSDEDGDLFKCAFTVVVYRTY